MHVHLFGHLKYGFSKDGLSNFGGILLLVHLNQILLILFLYPQVVCGPVYSQHGLQLSGETSPLCCIELYRYKQYIVKHNSINDFIKVYSDTSANKWPC